MARSRPLPNPPLLLPCLTAAGCETGTSPGSAFIMRDNLGTEIVESAAWCPETFEFRIPRRTTFSASVRTRWECRASGCPWSSGG